VLKAKRIIKAQFRVLGDLDELKEPVDDIVIKKVKKQRVKKQIIVYNNDTTDFEDDNSDWEPVVKKHRKNRPVLVEPVPAVEPVKPVSEQIIKFI